MAVSSQGPCSCIPSYVCVCERERERERERKRKRERGREGESGRREEELGGVCCMGNEKKSLLSLNRLFL